MDRLAKKAFVDRFGQEVSANPCMLVVTHSGLDASAISNFRRQVRSVGGTFEVVKNTLARKALGKDSDLAQAFRFPTAVLFSDDPISLSKISVNFAKEQKDKFKIVVGHLDGVKLSEKQIEALSVLPSLEELKSKLLRVLNGAATQLVSVLQAPARGVVTVLDAHQKNSIEKGDYIMDSKLLQIREELDKLTILEVAALVKDLENHWGVSAAAPVAMAAAAPADGGAEEQTEFKVVLKETGAKKIDVIKELRALTSLGLAEAKAASETAGFVIKEGISKADAEKIEKKFKELGASVSVE